MRVPVKDGVKGDDQGRASGDRLRAIDYLLTLDDVDPYTIGVTGNSGGGLNTLFTAVLDARDRANSARPVRWTAWKRCGEYNEFFRGEG
jgi:cephalosporin-C deacetylase-like acetyl esterase